MVSDKWGKGFENSIIVSGCDRGELYKFDLNPTRDGFVIQQSDLIDLSFDQGDSSESILFGENFWCVTDLEFDSNGNIVDYFVAMTNTSKNCGGGRTPWNTW